MKINAIIIAITLSLVIARASATVPVYYVDSNCSHPTPPYSDWSNAATNIQNAIDLAVPGAQVLVTNGIYNLGATFSSGSNRVTLNKSILVQSVNGPAVTVIQGYRMPGVTNGSSSVRCVYLADGAALSGFTLTNGSISGNGGGVYCQNSGIISNCVIEGNSSSSDGGGSYRGTYVNCVLRGNTSLSNGGGNAAGAFNNCLVVSNSCSAEGGGGYYTGGLTNCTVVGNNAKVDGGGVYGGASLKNCIVYYNYSPYGSNIFNFTSTSVRNCCTPDIFNNTCITNPPAFIDMVGGNYRLQIGSPCINRGDNTFVSSSLDLEGNPRSVGIVDMGAYENQDGNSAQYVIHYVSLSSTNPVSPYTAWPTAATNIQDAIGASHPGELIVADAGTYNQGGVVIYGQQTNRLALTNAITLLSLYGPQATTIVGGTQTRCVYISSNSVLSGFTIINGRSRTSGDITNEQSGGGIWCEEGALVTNCFVAGNSAWMSGGGVYRGTVYNSTFITNNASDGGAGASVSMVNCLITNNSSIQCVFQGILSNCTLIGNSGSGAQFCTLYNCTLKGNHGGIVGGAFQCTNFNCIFLDNTGSTAGGLYRGIAYNCLLSGNTGNSGGGTYSATLYSCTVVKNSASTSGGGIYGGAAYNSIVYLNSAPTGSNWANNPLIDHCCTMPVAVGPGNIASDPSFLDSNNGVFQLRCDSPCIDAGFTNNLIGALTNDIRGVERFLDGDGDGIAQIDMGAYEYKFAIDQMPIIGSLFGFDNFSTSYVVPFVATVGSCADYFWWDFGDGVTLTNQYNASHFWSSPGTFQIRLMAYYSYLGYPLCATTSIHVVQQPVYYVNATNSTPLAPYTNWAGAATKIQDAIDAGATPGRLVLVAAGLYRSYGRNFGTVYATTALTNILVLRSVDGPGATTIWPLSYDRCAYVGSNAILSGFTLTNGHGFGGGGAWCEPGAVVTNCMITSSQSDYDAGAGAYQGTFYNCTFSNNYTYGGSGGAAYKAILYNCCLVSNKAGANAGGALDCLLYNCTLKGNHASWDGGGAYSNTLWNCVLIGNSAGGNGGGAYSNTLWNCVLTGNTAGNYGGGAYSSVLHSCLITSNRAAMKGGGAYFNNTGGFDNCTISANTASYAGGVGLPGNQQLFGYNSIIYGNFATNGFNDLDFGASGSNCCSTFIIGPPYWGNITNDPGFVNPAIGNFHLQPNSRCINSGNNNYVYGSTDLDANLRVRGATVDMGAYEFQAQVTGTLNSWLQQHGLAVDGPADSSDSDGDGLSNLQEWIAGTNPTNAQSALQMAPLLCTNNSTGVVVSWQSISGVTYYLQRCSDLSAGFSSIQSNLFGLEGTTSYTDTTATNGTSYFYRVGVQ